MYTTFRIPDTNVTVDGNFEKFSNERKLAITLLIGIPPIGIILYIPLIYIILKRHKKYTNAFYRLVLCVGVNDYFMLFHLMYSGVCLAKNECPGGEKVNILQMTMAVFSCYVCMLMNLTIAWNRFTAVFFYRLYDTRLFTTKMVYFYVVFVLTASGLANIPAFTYGMKFYPDIMTHWFVKQPASDYIEIWHICDLLLGYGLHAALIILYIASFIKVYRMSTRSTSDSKNHRLLIQACINAIPCLLYINCYHFGTELGEFIFALICMVMTPFVYLWFNKDLRNDFLEMIRKKQVWPTTTSDISTQDLTRPTTGTAGSGRTISNAHVNPSLA